MARRSLVVVALTMVAACADSISYLGLGEVFPANMTGNTVLLGIGLATGNLDHVTRAATALGAFLLGATTVGATVPSPVRRWAFVGSIAAEVGLVGTLCGWWLVAGDATPGGVTRYGLIALAGATMGTQSGLARRLGFPVSTTYITGTWTALSTGLAARLRGPYANRSGARWLEALVVTTYLLTAVAAGYAYVQLGAIASVLPLAPLLVVLASAALPPHRRRPGAR